MKDPHIPDHIFYTSGEDVGYVREWKTETPQTKDPAYRLAFQDKDFLLREDLRPVRFQLELLKPEILLDEANIGSTLVFYGSARVPEPALADAVVDAAEGPRKKVAERLRAKAKYYDSARTLAQLASTCACDEEGRRQFVVCSGGGPSYMEAANRGAADVGAESLGLNIVLPHEQVPNEYVTPSLSFQFHYFALRKMHFLLRARAVAVFPGGYGTFDELFELLCLIQTGKMKAVPIILFGKEFWERVMNFEALAEEGTISSRDLDIIRFAETGEEAWEMILDFYREPHGWKCDPHLPIGE
jgi:hypothetical protein